MASLFKRLTQAIEPCEIDITFTGKPAGDDTQNITVEDVYLDPPVKDTFPLFAHNEPVAGVAVIKPLKKGLDFKDIRIEFMGRIDSTNEKEEHTEFVAESIAPSAAALEASCDPKVAAQKAAASGSSAMGGRLTGPLSVPFYFEVAKLYESYRGFNATVSYYVRAVVVRSPKTITKKREIWVHRVDTAKTPQPTSDSAPVWAKQDVFGPGHVSMDVGVDDVLHIEFKYDKKVFHLKERVLGQVSFRVVELPLSFGQVSIVKREYIGRAPAMIYETETLQRYEIMDGTPTRGEVVPIRLYLNAIPRLTPTYENVHEQFSVKYYLNLVLVTEDGKRYFKQQEITLYRLPGHQTAPQPDPATDQALAEIKKQALGARSGRAADGTEDEPAARGRGRSKPSSATAAAASGGSPTTTAAGGMAEGGSVAKPAAEESSDEEEDEEDENEIKKG
eukprot:TRINITY_DN35156_c0_g1_i1.p1 TRINITY_DN35156_c0_g1~~TRINITY_DN35156_c0_g1_i1.p1  ORF type:complete len:447 (-),score=108.69 TRINITY_DN35156_c0_g1_i1:152-1492(-)